MLDDLLSGGAGSGGHSEGGVELGGATDAVSPVGVEAGLSPSGVGGHAVASRLG